jgi:UDP-2,3-diacylglucosamine pyrophosphatase LpxH
MDKRAVDVAVLSDLHLGTYGSQAAGIVGYLRSITPQLLILNGDIIDIWQFNKHYFPAAHLEVIREILNLLSNGTRVIYITGNHDEALRRYSGISLGNFQITDKLLLEINGQLTWIFHGDVFDNTTRGGAKILARLGSAGYGLLMHVNRFINNFIVLLGYERISLSKKLVAGVNKAIAAMNNMERIASELAIERHYDFVICGHSHQPCKKTISTNKGSVVYLNSGDWVEHSTALEYQNNHWNLNEYKKPLLQAANTGKGSPAITVITDEVGLHYHSLKETTI